MTDKSLAGLFSSTLNFFKAALETARTEALLREPNDQLRLEKSLASLFFWGNDYDVGDGALDDRLRLSPSLRDMVESILITAANAVRQGFMEHVLDKYKHRDLLKQAVRLGHQVWSRRLVKSGEATSLEEVIKNIEAAVECLGVLDLALNDLAAEMPQGELMGRRLTRAEGVEFDDTSLVVCSPNDTPPLTSSTLPGPAVYSRLEQQAPAPYSSATPPTAYSPHVEGPPFASSGRSILHDLGGDGQHEYQGPGSRYHIERSRYLRRMNHRSPEQPGQQLSFRPPGYQAPGLDSSLGNQGPRHDAPPGQQAPEHHVLPGYRAREGMAGLTSTSQPSTTTELQPDIDAAPSYGRFHVGGTDFRPTWLQ